MPQNALAAWRISMFASRREPIVDVSRYERRITSQNGEDGILEAIFAKLGTTNRYFVEFGVGDGRERNTAYLQRRHGWRGLLMDRVPNSRRNVKGELVTAENINRLLEKYGVPTSFDLLSVDIDGNDYWVWKAITGWRPRVVVIEYNASVPPTDSLVIPYRPDFVWSGTDFFGASLRALAQLGERKGYRLIGCESHGVNAFFVDEPLIDGHFVLQDVRQLYRPPRYADGSRHPPDPRRKMIAV